jgi:glycosyltransferase involved in cell wall biosynthesis
LRGTPTKGYDNHLRTLAQRSGVADRLHLLPPVAPDEIERQGAQYDLGYVGEVAQTRNRQIALTNKLFSYLIGGVPIVASNIPAHVALISDLGQAMSLFPTGDAESLAATLDRLLMYPDRLSAARLHAWNLAQHRFCWEMERKVFLSAVEKHLGQRSVAA